MARFDVFQHPDAQLRTSTPFLLDVQNDYINGLNTRIVIPMRAASLVPLPMKNLNPAFEIDSIRVVLDSAALGAFPAGELKHPIASLRAQADFIVDALDALFGGY